MSGRLDVALRALALDPAGPAAWITVAEALTEADRDDEALAAYREALHVDGHDLQAAANVARAAIRAGRAEIELARAATSPDAASLMIRLRLLRHLRRNDEAARVAGDLVALVPGSPLAAAEHAEYLYDRAADRQAEAALLRALALDPTNAKLRVKLGRTLLRTGRPDAARDAFESCPATADDAWRLDLALANLQLGRHAEALRHATNARDSGGCERDAWRLIATISAYAPDVDGPALTEIMRCAAATEPVDPGVPPAHDRDPERRLRLGFLGGGFWRHPSSWLTLRGIEALDRDRFEIHCFAPGHVTDDFTSRWRILATRWHTIDTVDDAAVAALIRANRIDVLIDIGGCLNIGRLGVLRYRAAPVQIKWVGAQFHTTAMPTIDWFVGDPYETPQSLESLYTEKLLRLGKSYVCYAPPDDAPDVTSLPADSDGLVTFGSFNSLMKITPDVVECWSRILRGVERSRLVIKAPAFDEETTVARLVADFARHGIDADRLVVGGETTHRAMLEAYNSVDVALQPFPYCGGVNLLEGLWMGVPSVALAGETFAGRHGVTHLFNVGLADCVASDPVSYVATAVALAQDRPRLRAIRSGLRRRLARSPICDARLFATEFATLLRTAWRDHCGGPVPGDGSNDTAPGSGKVPSSTDVSEAS